MRRGPNRTRGHSPAAAVRALAARGFDDVVAPDRPCTGSLKDELEAVSGFVGDAWVVGQSGGATLVLALAASGIRMAGGIAHEPAVGSLLPGLLTPAATAFAEGGTTRFARTLYGASWLPEMAGPDTDAVRRELPMFRSFEPARRASGQGDVLVTVGEGSPRPRHEAAHALRHTLGYRVATIPAVAHFVAWDAPDVFAELIAREINDARRTAQPGDFDDACIG